MANQLFDIRTFHNYYMRFQDTYVAGTLNVYAGSATSVLELFQQFWAVSTDTVDQVLSLWLYDGTNSILLKSVTIPAGAGTGAVPAVDLLGALSNQTPPSFYLAPTFRIQASLAAAPSTGKLVYLNSQSGVF